MDHQPGRWLSLIAASSAKYAHWVVLGWLAVVVALNIAVPQLETVVAEDSTPIAPNDTAAVQTIEKMDTTFSNGRSTSFAFVVLEREGGLTKADRKYARSLVPTLRADHENVSFVQDVVRQPKLLDALTSRDKEAMYLQVGIPGSTGAPDALKQVHAVRDLVVKDRPEGLDVAVTGPAATIADMSHTVERSILKITIVTVGVIALILMLIYRSVMVTALTLTVIGLALAASRAVTSLLGLHIFNVSTFTASFLTAVVLGAATDYVVFLISRYHELRRAGVEHQEAVVTAAGRVSGVIIGSALTVVLANACMALADVGIFTTTGPAIAVSVAITLLMSLTLAPALIALCGARGFLAPRPLRSVARWDALAGAVVARPARLLMAGLVPLVGLAVLYPLLSVSFDERANQSPETDSNRGYTILSDHFPLNEVLPDYVLISADHDMRNAKDLAALEQASAAIARTPGVALVRGVTRPLGTPITDASISHQAGVIGDRLDGAGDRLANGRKGSTQLDDGAGQLSSGAGRVAKGADQAVTGASKLVAGARKLEVGITRLADGSDTATAGSAKLRRGADALADGLDSAYAQTKVAVDGLGLAYDALTKSLTCGLDPYCRPARDGIRRIYEGERDELLPGLAKAAAAARRIADGSIELEEGLTQLSSGLDDAEAGTTRLASGQRLMHDKLDELADGAGLVSDASGKVKAGTEEMAKSLAQLESGLTRAASYLQEAGAVSNDPAVGGFFLPPAALKDPRLALATGLFLSADGRTARLVVLGETNSFKRPAMERTAAIRSATETGLRNTTLAGSQVDLTGIASIMADLEEASQDDFHLVAVVALLAVFLILLFLLRSVVAALFLLGSVVLSYAAAMGLAVLTWQVWLDKPLDWSVPMIAFILLVAVGADYNLLLMKRIQEEAPDGARAGIARAVTATGGVITTAGVIFAASMFAMMTGSVTILTQIGFTIGMGLLLDTFIVRTIVVPAIAALLGPRLWWPVNRSTPTRDASAC